MLGDYSGSVPSYAQSPLTYGYTVGTTVTAVIGANPNRRGLIIHNPNAVAMVAIAPAINAANGAGLVPAIGGAGSTVIVPFGSVTIMGLPCSNNFNAITDTIGATITLWEFV